MGDLPAGPRGGHQVPRLQHPRAAGALLKGSCLSNLDVLTGQLNLRRVHVRQKVLPTAKKGGEPLPEGLLWLLLTGEVHGRRVHCSARVVEVVNLLQPSTRSFFDHLPSWSCSSPSTQLVSGSGMVPGKERAAGVKAAKARTPSCSSAGRGAAQVPSKEQVAGVTADLAARAQLPAHLSSVLAALPKDTHPMVQFSTAVLALQVRPRRAAPSHASSSSAPVHLGSACPRSATLRLMVPLASGALGCGCLGSVLVASEEPGADARPWAGARRQPASQFAAAYARGVPKTKYWEYAYEDSMDLIAKLPSVAAHIYRTTYHAGKHIGFKRDLDWAANLSHMMGAAQPCFAARQAGEPAGPRSGGANTRVRCRAGYEQEEAVELMRLYQTIHADHEARRPARCVPQRGRGAWSATGPGPGAALEGGAAGAQGGNVSAHATHLVGSALSDPYLSFSAGMNGLAGPLHGLANQEVLGWMLDVKKQVRAAGLPPPVVRSQR